MEKGSLLCLSAFHVNEPPSANNEVEVHERQGKIVLIDGARTPIGSFGGVFKDVPGFELGASASRAALERSEIQPVDIGSTGAILALRVAISGGHAFVALFRKSG